MKKVLLLMHKKLNIWLPPGGHIELGEDPNEAAMRETKEETGLDITLIGESKKYDTQYDSQDLIRPRFLTRHFYDTSHSHEHVSLVFFARTNSTFVQHEIEGMSIQWFSREEIDYPQYDIVADVRFNAHTALQELGA